MFKNEDECSGKSVEKQWFESWSRSWSNPDSIECWIHALPIFHLCCHGSEKCKGGKDAKKIFLKSQKALRPIIESGQVQRQWIDLDASHPNYTWHVTKIWKFISNQITNKKATAITMAVNWSQSISSQDNCIWHYIQIFTFHIHKSHEITFYLIGISLESRL